MNIWIYFVFTTTATISSLAPNSYTWHIHSYNSFVNRFLYFDWKLSYYQVENAFYFADDWIIPVLELYSWFSLGNMLDKVKMNCINVESFEWILHSWTWGKKSKNMITWQLNTSHSFIKVIYDSKRDVDIQRELCSQSKFNYSIYLFDEWRL